MLVYIILCVFAIIPLTTVYALPGDAELVLKQINISPLHPEQGQLVSITSDIENIGLKNTNLFSSIITIAYLVDDKLLYIDDLGNIKPGLSNTLHLSSPPIWNPDSGMHKVQVIVDYHDTLGDNYDSPQNNSLVKSFLIEYKKQTKLTIDTFPHHFTQKGASQVLISLFDSESGKPLPNKPIFLNYANNNSILTTNANGTISFSTMVSTDGTKIEARFNGDNLYSSTERSSYLYSFSGNNSYAVMHVPDFTNQYVSSNHKIDVLVFQDSYDVFLEKFTPALTDLADSKSFFIPIPANHEYIMEVYLGGRLIDAFQYFIGNNEIIEKEILISESAEIKFNAIDRFGEPQNNVKIDNWIYSANTDETGFTDWIQILPTVSDNEPYVAKALFSDGSVVWSEPFQVSSGEKKIVTITKEGTR